MERMLELQQCSKGTPVQHPGCPPLLLGVGAGCQLCRLNFSRDEGYN